MRFCFSDHIIAFRYGRRSQKNKGLDENREAEPNTDVPPLLNRDDVDSTYGRRRRRKKNRGFRLASRCQVSQTEGFQCFNCKTKHLTCFCLFRWLKSVIALRPSSWFSQPSVSHLLRPCPPVSLHPVRMQQRGHLRCRHGAAFLGRTPKSSHLYSHAPLWSTYSAPPQAPPLPAHPHQAPSPNVAGRRGVRWTCRG